VDVLRKIENSPYPEHVSMKLHISCIITFVTVTRIFLHTHGLSGPYIKIEVIICFKIKYLETA
jgi:hypothetical protein